DSHEYQPAMYSVNKRRLASKPVRKEETCLPGSDEAIASRGRDRTLASSAPVTACGAREEKKHTK
ncbi:MAG TPA: hypothetical protein VK565_06555, partial [Gemmatimonadaceae bacterium]|nr:hypothetical protein [Gemmatimonadaceae bacterium]